MTTWQVTTTDPKGNTTTRRFKDTILTTQDGTSTRLGKDQAQAYIQDREKHGATILGVEEVDE